MMGTLLNGRFRIIQVLGSGGFGQTYIAEDILQPDRPQCVIKHFKPAYQEPGFLQIARRLFATEVETLRKLGSHDQIPTLLADFEENEEFYLAQEYVEGQPLSDELAAAKRLEEATVTALLRDVLQVLTFVHQNNVIHRDIKPGNLIRRQRDGKFVLIDFGAVKEIQTQITSMVPGQTELTVGIGTHGYGPSEQMMGKPRYNSDLYALGMTAITALTGLQPFQLPTHPETGEAIWCDQAQVSPGLAAILTKMTRYHFSQRYQTAQSALYALDHPTEIVADDTQLPMTLSTYLPTEVLNRALDRASQPQTDQLALTHSQPLSESVLGVDNRPRGKLARVAVGIASFAVTGLILGLRQLGWLQPLELAAYDRLVQVSPDPGLDHRLLVVGITEADIAAQKRFPVADHTLAQAITTLQTAKPRVIGLDLLRDIPQPPGRTEFLAAINAPNVIAITNLGSAATPAAPAPPGVPLDRIGFNDFVLDPGDVLRRNLLFADSAVNHTATVDKRPTTFYSFSLRLALTYLANQKLSLQPRSNDPGLFQLGKTQFSPLESQAGGYQAIDARGYQVLLKYRGRAIARQVSLSDILNGKVQPDWVKDKVVLIGTTAPSGKDLFSTPYSAASDETPRMAGVLLHAQMVSQLLDAALEGRSLFWFWSEWVEALWIAVWAAIGGALAWYIRQPMVLALSGTLLLLSLAVIVFSLFLQQGWIPLIAPAFAATATGGLVIAYRGYWSQPSDKVGRS
ncbi:CHASE2 domain-containing protein [Phormidium sp. FACHB-592]|uniref:non-specific serine/threonine protein kinase n=1 Tax=Stenomitos frigidus AS-A4 TaxID=2933935 RepID=A0ABV0KF76_9CYAN|nr:CHASE2 domain-containing protein [Phormidium sp. FACHB-592]MBD2077620.1 CHASE2 domain-containing protein [Phormidium sp. FACHB-592]